MKPDNYYGILLAILLLFTHTADAQILLLNNDFENFDYNVKQIDEFILRFNLKELLVQPHQSDQYERDNRILLFDKSYYLDNSNEMNEFLNSIEEQNTILNFYDSTWYAIADCNVTYKGNKDKISLKLRTEQVQDDIYKWSIVDAYGSILELSPKTKSDRLRLLPTDNEVNFIALQSITTDNSQNITLFSEKNHRIDRLSVFNCLVFNKLLKIDNVYELSYCFTQVNGYEFFVKNFTRDEKNAGWLIYKVQKKAPQDPNRTEENNTIAATKQQVLQFYSMLSNYAKNPSDISLAIKIQSLFYKEQKSNFFFSAKHIYDDVSVLYNNYPSSYAYVSISDYLNTIDWITQLGVTLSYEVDDLKIIYEDGKIVNIAYDVRLKNDNDILCEYQAMATIRDEVIESIVLL